MFFGYFINFLTFKWKTMCSVLAYLITYLFYVIYTFLELFQCNGNHTFVKEKCSSYLFEAFMLAGEKFFRKFFFLIETYCWQSLVYKTFAKNNSMCFYVFPLSFEMRIVWRLSRFHHDGEAPYFCIKWLCLFALASRITICSQVTKFLQHDLQ